MKIFIGWDSREQVAWDVCAYSIRRNASQPVEIYPLKQEHLRNLGIYKRPPDQNAATEFSLTRFLVPYLCDYQGWALFMDCDMLVTEDINDLPRLFNEKDKAVYVTQHNYVPKQTIKMDGQVQHNYPRKNWSSFIWFNCEHPTNQLLTPRVVNATGELYNQENQKMPVPAFLHRFGWLRDFQLGNLSNDYNYLIGEYDLPKKLPFNIHWTLGGPWFADKPECINCGLNRVWLQYLGEYCGVDIPYICEDDMEQEIKSLLYLYEQQKCHSR